MTDVRMKCTATESSVSARQFLNMKSRDSRAGQGYSDVLCHPAYGNVSYRSGEAQVPILQLVQVTFSHSVIDIFSQLAF